MCVIGDMLYQRMCYVFYYCVVTSDNISYVSLLSHYAIKMSCVLWVICYIRECVMYVYYCVVTSDSISYVSLLSHYTIKMSCVISENVLCMFIIVLLHQITFHMSHCYHIILLRCHVCYG